MVRTINNNSITIDTNASGNAADITVAAITGGSNNLTLSTGAGADTITWGASATAAKTYTIDGGDGADILSISTNSLNLNAGTAFTMSNVETINLENGVTALTIGSALVSGKGIIIDHATEADTFDITVAFTWKGAAIASAVMAFPLMVRAVRLSLDTMDRGLEVAARTLGASRTIVFLSITLPLSLPGILTGTILAFARSLGEFGATITFVSNIPGETQTIPLALYNFTQIPGDQTPAIRLLTISVVVAFAALIASDLLARKVKNRLGTKFEADQ